MAAESVVRETDLLDFGVGVYNSPLEHGHKVPQVGGHASTSQPDEGGEKGHERETEFLRWLCDLLGAETSHHHGNEEREEESDVFHRR